MTIKVHMATQPYTLEEQDVQLFYNANLHMIDSLEKFASWYDETPEHQNAIDNIKEEINERRKLSLHIYETCFGGGIMRNDEQPRVPFDERSKP